jgi:hypothetical protein
MNLHIRANHLGAYATDARPIERIGPYGEQVLDEVIVESVHPTGRGRVHLTPDQALALLGRLTQLDAAFFHGAPPIDFVIHEVTHTADGELAWPVVRTNGHGTLECEEVIVADGAGLGAVHLSPDQVRYLERRLTALTLAYLHENAWGGEDSRSQ